MQISWDGLRRAPCPQARAQEIFNVKKNPFDVKFGHVETKTYYLKLKSTIFKFFMWERPVEQKKGAKPGGATRPNKKLQFVA